MKKLLFGIAMLAMATDSWADVTLPQCLQFAEDNYPLIKRYDLLSQTEDINLSDINKGWLPRVGVYAQVTGQNIVPSFPATLSAVMQQMGGEIKGLGKVQYKIGVDLQQTIWDGGASKTQRELARRRTELDRASTEVELYAIRERVQSLYFGILLLQSQIEQTEASLKVYEANLQRMQSMVKNGVAMQSDVDQLAAQILTIRQQLVQAQTAVKGYRDMLSIFTATNLQEERFILPEDVIPADMESNRPELNLFQKQILLNEAQRRQVNVSLMPKVGFFAQGYYGYPGIDYFKAMMSRDLSFNIVAGVKASWNIDAFYTKKNSLRRLDIADSQVDVQRETFLFNTSMQTASQREEIAGIRKMMNDDEQIIQLRSNVRMAAESQLRNGVIDATSLSMKINEETQAKLAAAYHSIQYLQSIYKLKNTLNR